MPLPELSNVSVVRREPFLPWKLRIAQSASREFTSNCKSDRSRFAGILEAILPIPTHANRSNTHGSAAGHRSRP